MALAKSHPLSFSPTKRGNNFYPEAPLGFRKGRIRGSACSGKVVFSQRKGIPQTSAQAAGTGSVYWASTKSTLQNELLRSAQLFGTGFEGFCFWSQLSALNHQGMRHLESEEGGRLAGWPSGEEHWLLLQRTELGSTTHRGQTIQLSLQFQRIRCLLLAYLSSSHAWDTQTYMQAKPCIHKIKMNKFTFFFLSERGTLE